MDAANRPQWMLKSWLLSCWPVRGRMQGAKKDKVYWIDSNLKLFKTVYQWKLKLASAGHMQKNEKLTS